MHPRHIYSLIVAYCVIGLLTFGYAASNTMSCDNAPSRQLAMDCRFLAGTMGGIFWPLYVSWSLFEKGK